MADNPDHPRNPRDIILADLFAQSHPNITWAIRRAPTYKKALDANAAYAAFINHGSEFLDNVEMGLEIMASATVQPPPTSR
jgi:hypothetical protein